MIESTQSLYILPNVDSEDDEKLDAKEHISIVSHVTKEELELIKV